MILEDGLIVVLRSSRIMVFMGHIYFQIVLPCVLSQADEFIWPLACSWCRQGLEDPRMVTNDAGARCEVVITLARYTDSSRHNTVRGANQR